MHITTYYKFKNFQVMQRAVLRNFDWTRGPLIVSKWWQKLKRQNTTAYFAEFSQRDYQKAILSQGSEE